MKRRASLAAINITPLVDVLLILVAVLLLLAPHFVKPLPVELPRTSLQGRPVPRQALQVAVLATGQLWLNGQEATLADIRLQIVPGQTTLEIGATGSVPYARVVEVVEALRDSQPREIELLAQ